MLFGLMIKKQKEYSLSRVGREKPPPPRQTGHADFPHPAFLKTLALGMHSYEPSFITNRSTPSAQIAHKRLFLSVVAMDVDCDETDDNKAFHVHTC